MAGGFIGFNEFKPNLRCSLFWFQGALLPKCRLWGAAAPGGAAEGNQKHGGRERKRDTPLVHKRLLQDWFPGTMTEPSLISQETSRCW